MGPALLPLFLAQIAPILVATVPRTVTPVGAENAAELVQDALASACAAIHELEKRGQEAIPRSVAYCTIQRLRSGRRSYGSGRTDGRVFRDWIRVRGFWVVVEAARRFDPVRKTLEPARSGLVLGTLPGGARGLPIPRNPVRRFGHPSMPPYSRPAR